MFFQDFVTNLQKKPYHVRLRILWGTSLIVGIILVLIWIQSINLGIQKVKESDSILGTDFSIENTNNYIRVERVERTDKTLKILFAIKNSTSDILNFPPADEIVLSIDSQSLNPSYILDRQSKQFVQKVLSKTENFGTLIFTHSAEDENAKLSFDGLYFESTPESIFSETFELDLAKLQTPQELRQ